LLNNNQNSSEEKKNSVAEYRVCSAIGPSELSIQVNELLQKGFVLYGSPTITMAVDTPDNRLLEFSQAVVKPAQEKSVTLEVTSIWGYMTKFDLEAESLMNDGWRMIGTPFVLDPGTRSFGATFIREKK